MLLTDDFEDIVLIVVCRYQRHAVDGGGRMKRRLKMHLREPLTISWMIVCRYNALGCKFREVLGIGLSEQPIATLASVDQRVAAQRLAFREDMT